MPSTPDAPLQSRVVDDKSPICIPFILSRLEAHKKQQAAAGTAKPFIIGLNGVQGVGKTTLVRALAETLQEREGLPTLVVSIDDFYLPHADQLALAAAHPDNALIQYRGEPGTHDVPLATSFLSALTAGQPTRVPQYDKAAFSGLGDRVPPSQWPAVNEPGKPCIRVVLLEGWCVGFRALSDAAVEEAWQAPLARTLHRHTLENLLFVNNQLRAYDALTDQLDAFIHIDAEDTEYVYVWRGQQEEQLRRERGTGMTDEQVVKFVDAYYPAYELFSYGVCRGIFPDRPGCQLRLVVGRDRSVQDKIVI
ncbi:P-loop containing nucleoside triphosphate hydrolase protein [Lasiosphaeria hispida]|uniref:P-loop containing nucleoside triphosphate hydrolase protein n=1 Tax=Lasiosphaeria hispida TaxID=260671 RepID=A0AAJ0HJR5_9PEZI|nr:P-loop containing nucleoside triphosphate hydrolase protein [Lasiosphaeria hispida]